MIAIALVGSPALLIMDEPTSNLDYQSREMIWNLLVSLAKSPYSKMSVLVSTQHIEEAEYLRSRILIINDGRQVMFDTP